VGLAPDEAYAACGPVAAVAFAQAYGRNPTRGTVFGLGAGVAYVGFLLLLRRGGADLRRPAGPLFDATATATVLCVVAGVVIGDAKLVPSWPSAGWLITLALTSQVLGWLLITSSLPRLPAALTSVLLTVQPVGSVALGALIFGESPSGLQLIGVAVVLTALLRATRPRGSADTTTDTTTETAVETATPVNAGPPGQAIAGASGKRSSAARMSSSENSGSSSSPARKAS